MVRDTRDIENLGFSPWQEAPRLLVARAREWREGATAHLCCSLYLPASFVVCILMVYLEAIFKNLFGRIFKQPTRRWICNLNNGLSGPPPSPHPPGQGRRPAASCFPFGAWAWLQDSPCTAVWPLLVTSPVPCLHLTDDFCRSWQSTAILSLTDSLPSSRRDSQYSQPMTMKGAATASHRPVPGLPSQTTGNPQHTLTPAYLGLPLLLCSELTRPCGLAVPFARAEASEIESKGLVWAETQSKAGGMQALKPGSLGTV